MPASLPTGPITSGDLVLRLPRRSDVAALTEACQDPEIPRWTLVPSPYTLAHARDWVPDAAAQAREGIGLHLLVCDRATDALLGAVGLMELDALRGGYGEIGYWVAASARGRGVATGAVVAVRDLAASLGIGTLEILPHRDNLASRTVAERAGFERTDELRRAPRTTVPGEADHLVYLWRASSSA